jgi:ribosomal 50S subunit-recycling heat shock protein
VPDLDDESIVIVKPRFLRYNVGVRLDLFLKTCRLIKRRTIAQEMCEAGRILVNGLEAKPAKGVKTGDVLTLKFSSRMLVLTVLEIPPSSKKASSDAFYAVKSETRLSRERDLWSENPSS